MIKECIRIIVVVGVVLMGLISIVGTGGGEGGDEREDGLFSYRDGEQDAGYPDLWDTLRSCSEIVDICVDQYNSCVFDCNANYQAVSQEWYQCTGNCYDNEDYCFESYGGDYRGIPIKDVYWCDPRDDEDVGQAKDELTDGYTELWDTQVSCQDIIDTCDGQYDSCINDCNTIYQLGSNEWILCVVNCESDYNGCFDMSGGDPREVIYSEVDWCDPRGL